MLDKRAEWDAGKITRAELRPAEEKAIREIVALQKEIGLNAVTDGEYTRCIKPREKLTLAPGMLNGGLLWGVRIDTCFSMECSIISMALFTCLTVCRLRLF